MTDGCRVSHVRPEQHTLESGVSALCRYRGPFPPDLSAAHGECWAHAPYGQAHPGQQQSVWRMVHDA